MQARPETPRPETHKYSLGQESVRVLVGAFMDINAMFNGGKRILTKLDVSVLRGKAKKRGVHSSSKQ